MHSFQQNINTLFGIPIQYHSAISGGDLARSHIDELNRQLQLIFGPRAKPKPSANELAFRELDVQAGDLVRLIPRDPAIGAQLEGRVEQIKTVNGGLESQLRIKGFDETPHGNHNAYFGVETNEVEVLERAFRWTEDDRIVTVLYALSDAEWERWPEANRGYYRKQSAGRIAKIKNIFAT